MRLKRFGIDKAIKCTIESKFDQLHQALVVLPRRLCFSVAVVDPTESVESALVVKLGNPPLGESGGDRVLNAPCRLGVTVTFSVAKHLCSTKLNMGQLI